MKKNYFILMVLSIIFTFSVFAEHAVGDVRQHQGWYVVRLEIHPLGNVMVYVTQCYPSGDEFEIIGNERERLPLYVKVLCLSLLDEIKGSFDFDELTFEEEGLFFQMTSFSLTFVFNFTMPDEEILLILGDQMVNRYRHIRWP